MARIRRLFNKLPGQHGQIKMGINLSILPNEIYEYAVAYRNVYTRSVPMLKKAKDPNGPEHQDLNQYFGKTQALAAQIAFSNELLLKAILWGSSRTIPKEHNLKKLINNLDERYIAIIKEHLENNGLKTGKWEKVLNKSANIFTIARYGFDNGKYVIDFKTLQLLNEALDYIFNNKLPDWTNLNKVEQENKERLKAEVDKIFDRNYQKEQRKLQRFWGKVFDD